MGDVILNYFQDLVQERISVSKRVKDIDLLPVPLLKEERNASTSASVTYPWIETIVDGPKGLVGDIPGCRAAEDHALSNQSEHKVVGGLSLPRMSWKRGPPQFLRSHEATAH
jgi:hypothetical protein